jgi:hypothetical protein
MIPSELLQCTTRWSSARIECFRKTWTQVVDPIKESVQFAFTHGKILSQSLSSAPCSAAAPGVGPRGQVGDVVDLAHRRPRGQVPFTSWIVPKGLMAAVKIVNAYQWVLDPRWGCFHVRLDGHKAGLAPLHESLTTSVMPGAHNVRVRLWWYRSRDVEVTARPGETVELVADIRRERPVLKRIAELMFRPGSSLSLKPGS